jgi:hypothetical protein
MPGRQANILLPVPWWFRRPQEGALRAFGTFVVAALALGLFGAASAGATDLIVNGSFENPGVGGGYALIANGGIPGWTTTDSQGLIEIDASIFGAPAYDGTQSLEVNAYNPEDVQQTVSGLTVGQTYALSWAYGDRPGSGDEELQVYFGADLVATNYDSLNGINPVLLWFPNVFVVTATSTSEVLSFNGIYDNGLSNNGGVSYGNEIDAVSLVATPEPSSILLFASGLFLLGCAWFRQRALCAVQR